MIVRSDAIVLKSIPYGETSLIVTLFTRTYGKTTVIAKGARVPGSRFGASLQMLSYSQVVFYHKAGRGVHTLSESSIAEPLLKLHRDMRHLGVAVRSVELVASLLHEEEENPLLFNLLVQVLHYLNEPLRFPENVLSYFQLRTAGALGFAPRIDREAVVAVGEEGARISLASGAIVPNSAEASRRISRSAVRAFAVFARADLDVVIRMELRPEVRREVDALIEDFMRYHVEDAYPTRSSRVLGQLRDLENGP
ncbi:MAG: DNA repair protein RecO [Bacteroidota bacterium]